MSLLSRLGMAIARPRLALSIAGDRRHAGRSGSDLLVALAILVAATSLHTVVGAVWLGAAVEPLLGMRGVVHVLTGALTLAFAALVIVAAVLWGAGRRDLGRAFDLACVAIVPLVVVDLIARVAVQAAAVAVPGAAMWAVTAAAFAWTGAVVALAVPEARRGSSPRPEDAEVAVARRAGGAVAAVAVVGVALQIVWIARNVDSVRPLVAGAPAPALSLPAVGAHGELGPPTTLAPGKPIVVDFWATWCKPCLAAMPELDAFAKKHPEVAVYAVNLDDPAAARALFDARGYTMNLLSDDGETSERFGVTSIPHTVVIDPSGTVRRIARGGGVDLEREVH